MNRNTPKERKYSIYKAILELKDLDECIAFFDDVCAVTELRSMEQRFEVAKMLHENKVYTEIMEQTSASSATISRVNRSLNYGNDGYDMLFARMNWEENDHKEE